MYIFPVIEKLQLQNPSQSTTQEGYNCKGNKCPASAAIDGNPDTGSITLNTGEIRHWQAELSTNTQFDFIMIRTGDGAFDLGYFNK